MAARPRQLTGHAHVNRPRVGAHDHARLLPERPVRVGASHDLRQVRGRRRDHAEHPPVAARERPRRRSMTWRQPTRIGGAAARTAVVPLELAVQPAAAASVAVATASAHLVSIRKANLVPSYPVGRAAHHDETARSADRGRDRRAVAVVREARDLGERVRFVVVELREPDKAVRWPRGAAAARGGARRARADGMTHEAVVALDERRLVDWRTCRRACRDHGDEFAEAGNAVVADPGFREALAGGASRTSTRHGRHVVGRLLRGRRPPPRARPRVAAQRPRRATTAMRARSAGWSRRRPEHDGGRAHRRPRRAAGAAGERGDYRHGGGRPYRDDLRPIEVTQPEGRASRSTATRSRWRAWRSRRLQPARVADAARLAFDAAAAGRATARRSPSSPSPTPIPTRPSSSRTRSTSASTASARS